MEWIQVSVNEASTSTIDGILHIEKTGGGVV